MTIDPPLRADPVPDRRKQMVRAFWEEEACGERSASGADERARLAEQARVRYAAEPYIHGFARFAEGAGKDVLEVGVGMGADHLEWARARPRRLCGVDLTRKAVSYTARRLELAGLRSELQVADAECLPFADGSFDLAYSWGVLHHTPRPEAGVRELHRVLRPGGTARVMLYHRNGMFFRLCWLWLGPLRGRFRGIDAVVASDVESEGTRVYSRAGARELFSAFRRVEVRTLVSMGDLLQGPIGRRHGGRGLEALKRVWPRPLVRHLGALGSYLVIEAVK